MSDENLKSAIERIRERFLSRLADQLSRSQQLAQVWQQQTDSTESLEELSAIAHKIAGLAKSVGFADLGDTAYQTDSVIQKYRDDEHSEASREDVAVAIDAFLATCDHTVNKDQDSGA